MNEISLLNARAGSTPSGTGSFVYFTNVSVMVQNVAFTKVVRVLGHTTLGTWTFFPCSYVRSVPGNHEVWQAHITGHQIDQFALEYQVAGQTYWDNNSGYDYRLDTVAAQTDGIGTAIINPNVLVVAVDVLAGTLNVLMLVKNIQFAKTVGIVYTTDNWATFHTAPAGYQKNYPPPKQPQQADAELWEVNVPLGAGANGWFAAFYALDGATYWDNNFTLNYSFP
jgi:hypothetical protein